MLLVAGVIALYTWIENWIEGRKASKRKVKFIKGKGYWVTKKGDNYDPDLKLED